MLHRHYPEPYSPQLPDHVALKSMSLENLYLNLYLPPVLVAHLKLLLAQSLVAPLPYSVGIKRLTHSPELYLFRSRKPQVSELLSAFLIHSPLTYGTHEVYLLQKQKVKEPVAGNACVAQKDETGE